MNKILSPEPIRPWLERTECCATFSTAIEVHDLSIYYSGRPALENVNMAISKGCVTAIVGPSGCGKSSFLNSLNRMTDLTPGCEVKGQVRIDGKNIHQPETDLIDLRQRVGMIFQKANPFPLSIRKNITYPLLHHKRGSHSDCEAIMENVLKRVGLWSEVKDRLAASAFSLSGGQLQRLCLARALALEPEVLLLDEPCSALDPIASGVIEDLVASLRGDYTIVIVTHNLAQAKRVADDVAMFWTQDGVGALIEFGRAVKVFETPISETTAAYLSGARG